MARAVPSIPAYSGPAVPDTRLASMFTKRSKSAPTTVGAVGMLGTYPPTRCGVASFAASLRDGLIVDRPGLTVGIVAVGATSGSVRDAVVHRLPAQTGAEDKAAAAELNKFDVAVIHHDFDIYAGDDGEQVLAVLDWIRVPVVAVVHTVPAEVSAGRRAVLEKLTRSADAVVAMSKTAHRRLLTEYAVAPRKVMFIPHGADPGTDRPDTTVAGRRPTLLTWGLLRPDRGIEQAIEAVAHLKKRRPALRYVIAGPTHAREYARAGDSYREELADRVRRLGLEELVEFEPDFLAPRRVRELLRGADAVLLPFSSADQASSAVLTEAVAAGVPVIATPFPHAVEMLDGERGGLLVAPDDPGAMASAVTRLLADPALARSLSAHSGGLAPLLSWAMVAGQYRQLFDALLRRPG